MKSADEIKRRIQELVAQVPSLVGRVNDGDYLVDAQALGACLGWIAAAYHEVQLACSVMPDSAYVTHADEVRRVARQQGYTAHQSVFEFAELLKQLLVDIDRGLLASVEQQVSSVTYDDLLDHAQAYLADGRKDPAGVIAGVVFEDTIHRLCVANGIEHASKTLDPLINALATARHLQGLEAKEAKTATGLRTSATHARWDEFNTEQVIAVIAFTRRMIREKLSA